MSSMRFKTGSHKEIQAVALNKTGTQCSYQCFPPEFGVCMCVCVCVAEGGVAGILWGLHSQNSHTALGEFDRRLWHRGGTLDVSARKLKKL